jgi:hypothetical protein
MSSRSTTTPMKSRAVATSTTRGDGPGAAISGRYGEAPRREIPSQGREADNAGLRRAKPAGAGSPASVTARVEVVFYKEILDDHGFPHRCELMRVPRESIVYDEAIADAIVEFERAHRVSDWTVVADGYEVEG